MERARPGRNPSSEGEARKRAIYESLSPRRRAFIDRIGYDQWNPFQEPKNPLELRGDAAKQAARQLTGEFLRSQPQEFSSAFAQGALECASGILSNDEKHLGAYGFCMWYHRNSGLQDGDSNRKGTDDESALQ